VKKRIVILDYDGTVTDAEAEGTPFLEAYRGALMIFSGLPRDEARELVESLERQVTTNSQGGWECDGKIVAPATDPFLRVRPLACAVFDHLGLFQKPSDRALLLGFLYLTLYKAHAGYVPRPDASMFLRQLLGMKGVFVYVVTNSGTESVQDKIARLDVGFDPKHVIGLAKKFVVGDKPSNIATTI